MSNFSAGTRRSRLALAQTKYVIDLLRRKNNQIHIDILEINSSGDLDVRPLYTFDKKGIFEKEIDQAVIEGRVDFAVHSAKDVPSELFSELELASVPTRSAYNDVLINREGLQLNMLPSGATVGTSSLRRAVQLIRKRADLKVKPIRGNIETRIQKVKAGQYDAIVLAQAGLERLGLTEHIAERFGVLDFIPAAGQGALALICKKSDVGLLNLLKSVEDSRSRAELEAERSLLSTVEGGCKFPVGVVAAGSRDRDLLTLCTEAFSADGSERISIKESGRIGEARKVGIRAAHRMLDKGVKDFSESWQSALKLWNTTL